MPKKYNLALIPVSKGVEVIRFANKFANLADKYLLSENSLPHITIYQFAAEEKEINDVWRKVKEAWKESLIDLEFKKFSCITLGDSIYGVSLLPDNHEKLQIMHALIARIINLPIKKSFDPHMTLVNTKNKEYKKEVERLSSDYEPISDKFILSLGISDDIGQLVKVVHCCEIS